MASQPQSMVSGPPLKRKEKELVREVFNKRVLELKHTFNAQVDNIALEFSGNGACYSRSQIHSQIIYNLAAPTKTRKPMLLNAWAHAKAQADHKREPLTSIELPDIPYSQEYLEILDDINENRITYEDIESQMTSTEEHYARILLEGVSVKRENRMVKQKVPSPELSMGRMTFHARSQLIQVAERIHEACGVEVLIMMTKGNNEDIFAPVLWGTPKAMDFWCGVLKIDMMENIRLMEGYCINTLKAVHGGGLEGVVTKYQARVGALRCEVAEYARTGLRKWQRPDENSESRLTKAGGITGKPRLSMEWSWGRNRYGALSRWDIAEPKTANLQHLQEVVEGWKTNRIKWVRLGEEEHKDRRKQLAELSTSTPDKNQSPSTGSSNTPHTLSVTRTERLRVLNPDLTLVAVLQLAQGIPHHRTTPPKRRSIQRVKPLRKPVRFVTMFGLVDEVVLYGKKANDAPGPEPTENAPNRLHIRLG
ncbi:uncharacterized protein EI90DRAFT_3015896 [Cantharellus anzutake]|uniref:uncharacterized protein n=1 Tax=Cantharellus anzutake TaxID=1750568 RepID=UPI001906BC93|nr:uncharacterized protein EI90DRAFT_3015896 [Cantharellus anzutake]KAF8332285.1 hypothetical protein EI90DRAFT_3015896 [Cantharellus anzutake]